MGHIMSYTQGIQYVMMIIIILESSFLVYSIGLAHDIRTDVLVLNSSVGMRNGQAVSKKFSLLLLTGMRKKISILT